MSKPFQLVNVQNLQIRSDSEGDGHFMASRKGRRHKGVDFEVNPGMLLLSMCSGVVKRIGYCYSDDLLYRLIEIDAGRAIVRYLYVSPLVEVGNIIEIGDVIGSAQNVAVRYTGDMKPHVHVEVKLTGKQLVGKGELPAGDVWIDPMDYIGDPE